MASPGVPGLGNPGKDSNGQWREMGATASLSRQSMSDIDIDDEEALRWASLERLPTVRRMQTGILDEDAGEEGGVAKKQQTDLTKLSAGQRMLLVERALATREQDNYLLLTRLRERIDRVGVQLPSVEVRFEDLTIDADVYVGSRGLPTLLNFTLNIFESLVGRLLKSKKQPFPILNGVSGILRPSRITLLLGPPGAGKTTLLTTLAGKMDKTLRMSGKITYNGHELHEFIPQRTAAYISQNDSHIGTLTVRETLDFSARCQGVSYRFDLMKELEAREKEQGIKPDTTVDAFMKALAIQGRSHNVMTDYTMKILGLDICADTLVGNEMVRGISGGQKKRVTTGEMIVGPKKTLFMDEISTGLDSSTTFQIVKCLRNYCHIFDGTCLMALLQPAPETFDLFDDIMLVSEGHIVYHGPREHILEFFEGMGFHCPERKGIADFLQEVTSIKDQEQYWSRPGQYKYVPVQAFADSFQAFRIGQQNRAELAQPFDRERSHPAALVKEKYALGAKDLFVANIEREALLMKRDAFLYIFKTCQVAVIAFVTMTLFFRTEFHANSITYGNIYMGALFFALVHMMFNGFAEMSITVSRLQVFYKQRNDLFYPGWAFAIPTWVLRLPYSVVEAVLWTSMTYYVIGFAPEPGRFFRHMLLMFCIHQMAIGLFRFIGALGRTMVIANTFGSFALVCVFLLGGFIVAKPSIHPWWIWGYWISPLTYGQNAIAVNEFGAPRWQRQLAPAGQGYPAGETLGNAILLSRGLHTHGWWYWVGVGALLGYTVLFNIAVISALQFLSPFGGGHVVLSEEAIRDKQANLTGEGLDVPGGSSSRMKQESALSNHLSQQSALSRHLSQRSALSDHLAQKSGLSGTSKAGGNRPSSRAMASGRTADVPPSPEAGGAGQQQVEMAAAGGGNGDKLWEDMEAGGGESKRGMILPFRPLPLTFHNVNYFVDMPQAMKSQGVTEDRLQLLRNVSGAFRPGVLTALVGVSGAGKTTLMDVLAGRKTGGYIEGDIRVAGFPKVQETFARISGYCEQTDIHSPQVTVRESLLYSAWLRLPSDVDKKTRELFVDEVMELVELAPLRGALVGLPGATGLSTEQRKRLTIAVELVANPSIIFMDEPTSGLDARAAAIVMRCVRNTVDTGRTVVCTIHQPSIDIFEAFDELLLMKRGGLVIYAGPLGTNSSLLVEYFESIQGVPKIAKGYNPATWMLEISTPYYEHEIGADYAELYRNSQTFKNLEQLIESLSVPPEGAEDLHFPTTYSTSFFVQFQANLWKNANRYWRTPQYKAVNLFFTWICALIFGSIFWGMGGKRTTQQQVFNVMGALYAATLFLGVNNSSTVQPVVSVERTVFWRERAAGMYAALPYAMAQGVIELPYVLVQTVTYGAITYSMIMFQWTAPKFLWYLLFTYLTFMYFTFFGMMSIAITPNQQMAAVISSAFYSLWNLFSGFLIAETYIPGWWVWFYWINPIAWTLYGLISSQLGDVQGTIVPQGSTTPVPLHSFITSYFGYHHYFLGLVVAVLVVFVFILWGLYAAGIKYLNFQKR